MVVTKESFVVDEGGRQIGVLLDIQDYQRLIECREELESIRAYDAAKASGEEPVPFEQAVADIEKSR